MKAYEIYQEIAPSIVEEMCQWLRGNEKELYNTALASLAANRKLRPIFVQRKQPKDQAVWLHKTLKLRTSDTVGEHLFQVWFMKGKQDILKAFCDGMGIEHDGEGQVEGDLPESLDAEKLKTTINTLLAGHEAPLVTVYLRVFNLQTQSGWESLTEALAKDERLKLA